MTTFKSVAIIGQGFVGGSLTTVLHERGFDVYVYDKAGKVAEGGINILAPTVDLDLSRVAQLAGLPRYDEDRVPGEPTETQNFVRACEEQEKFSGVYFVCLPTPMYEDGEADLRIVERTLNELAGIPGTRIAVVKSTIPPGTTERWNKMFEGTGLHVVFSPEFLTEANALDDMRNQNRIILGGPRPWINTVKLIFQRAFPKVPLIKTSSTTAEMVKYFTNVQLAARVVLSCELSQICEALDKNGMNIDYDKVVEYAKFDPRLGGSHMSVPGPEGIPGARGHCFPKDLNALTYVAKQVGVEPTVMEAVWKKNLEVVTPENRDWEKMHGRAVSKKAK
jgi:UDPglucose 6-dehydrogenase